MCKYCNKNKKIKSIDYKTDDSNLQIVKRYCKDYPQENLLYVEIQSDEDENMVCCNYFAINYCPICGEKLEIKTNK